jgi:NADH-quinone oxidoreductase subunit K
MGMFLSQQHLIIILLSLEIMLLSVNINLVLFSVLNDDIMGQIYAILILAIAAAETAIGLALVVLYYKIRGGISMDLIKLLKS